MLLKFRLKQPIALPCYQHHLWLNCHRRVLVLNDDSYTATITAKPSSYVTFRRVMGEVLVTVESHGRALWVRRSIDLSIKLSKAVLSRHSTGKVIGVSENAELVQINRSLNRLFTAAIEHDAQESRRREGPV